MVSVRITYMYNIKHSHRTCLLMIAKVYHNVGYVSRRTLVVSGRMTSFHCDSYSACNSGSDFEFLCFREVEFFENFESMSNGDFEKRNHKIIIALFSVDQLASYLFINFLQVAAAKFPRIMLKKDADRPSNSL